MVKVEEIIEYLGEKKLSPERLNEINSYIKTDEGKKLLDFLDKINYALFKNTSKEICEHPPEDILSFHAGILTKEEYKKIEDRILDCDVCFSAHQALLEYEKEFSNKKEDTSQKLVIGKKISSDNNQNIAIIKDEETTKKKIFSSLFFTGFSSGALIAACLALILFLPKINQTEETNSTNKNNGFISSMSSEKDKNSKEYKAFITGVKEYNSKNYDEAIKIFENLAKNNDKNEIKEIHFYLHLCYKETNENQLSEMELNKYLDALNNVIK